MKAVTFVEVGKLEMSDVPKPTILEPDDALIRVTTSAICGSDLHVLNGRIAGMMPGGIIGHEFIGIVEEVGPDVTSVKPGDRALASFMIPDGTCELCLKGQQGLCPNLRVFGYGLFMGDVNGGQAEYVRAPSANTCLHVIDNGFSDEQALFAGDILSTGVHVAEAAGIQEGDVVAVTGCGPVGLFAIQAAKAYKPSVIYAIDSIDQRLEMAQSFGATPINLKERNPAVFLQDSTPAGGADVLLECVGNPDALNMAFDCVRPGGRMAVIGVYAELEMTLPFGLIWRRGIDLRLCGSANVVGHWDLALKLVKDGTIDPAAIISHRMKLEDALKGYELFEKREAMKVVLTP